MEDFELEPRGKGKERIALNDNAMTITIKLAEGNPGALNVCLELIKNNASVDPISAWGEFGTLISFDSCGIYSSRIWMLFKDVCNQDIVKVIALMRAWGLGFVSKEDLLHAIDNYGKGIDVDDLVEQVLIRLPEFWKEGREDFLNKRNKSVSN
jgi:hypothetical protein